MIVIVMIVLMNIQWIREHQHPSNEVGFSRKAIYRGVNGQNGYREYQGSQINAALNVLFGKESIHDTIEDNYGLTRD